MNRLKINYLVDLLMVIAFLITAISGLILFLFLPGGFPRAGQQLCLAITRRGWIVIHNFAGVIVIILVLLHLILHWNWIIQVTKSWFKTDRHN